MAEIDEGAVRSLSGEELPKALNYIEARDVNEFRAYVRVA